MKAKSPANGRRAVAACAAHALAISRGWSDPVSGLDPFDSHRPADRSADRSEPQPAQRPVRAEAHHLVGRGGDVHAVHSQPRGHAYGRITHAHPHGHAYGWAAQAHGRALAKGHAKHAQ